MSEDRIAGIRARLDDWQRQKGLGTEGFWDGIQEYERLLCADIEWLLAEVEIWKERAKTQNPMIEIRGHDGSVWVRVDGLKVPTVGGAA